MIKRIKSLISVKNLSASQFADKLAVQRSNISHILSGRNKPSLDFILKITEVFPEVSIEWLLLGRGEMYNNKVENKKTFVPQLDLDLKSEINDEREVNIIKPIPQIEKPIIEKEVEIDANEEIPAIYSSLKQKDEKIEQLILLYPNGIFKTYSPEK